MKKVILSLVFVLATGTNILNAEIKTNKQKLLPDVNYSTDNLGTSIFDINYNEQELMFGCLTDAYNAANKLEEDSSSGAYGWNIEMWSYAFNALFEDCQDGGDIVDRINQG